jgi:hypothetical protein
MKTYAFLSAWWTTFNSLTVKEVTCNNSHLMITIDDDDQPHLVKIDDLPSYLVKADSIRQDQNTIATNTRVPRPDFLNSVAELYTQQKISSLIKNATFTKGEVTFLLKGKLVRLNKEKLPNLNYTKLIALEALASGYIIREEPGSHWIVVSPQGYQNVTKLHRCSCDEFAETKDCTHVRLATAFHESRHLNLGIYSFS